MRESDIFAWAGLAAVCANQSTLFRVTIPNFDYPRGKKCVAMGAAVVCLVTVANPPRDEFDVKCVSGGSELGNAKLHIEKWKTSRADQHVFLKNKLHV